MTWLVAFVTVIGILQIICLLGVFWGMVELRAMQKSTHSIQYVPVDPKFQGVTDELKEALSKDLFDNVV
jgi:uncharacterized membrane protein YhaH (DUF805 family)